MYQITIVDSYAPTCSFVSGLDAEPVLPSTGQGSENQRPEGGKVDTAALPWWSPGFSVFAFSVLVTERVSDLYNFGCTQMSERFRVPLWHVAPRTEEKQANYSSWKALRQAEGSCKYYTPFPA